MSVLLRWHGEVVLPLPCSFCKTIGGGSLASGPFQSFREQSLANCSSEALSVSVEHSCLASQRFWPDVFEQ